MCTSVTTYGSDMRGCKYEFRAMYDASIPEDQRFTKYTPSGSLEMFVDNDAVTFIPGQYYYLDFTLIDEPQTTLTAA